MDNHRLCLSCETTSVPAHPEADDKVIRVIQAGSAIGVICEDCQSQIKGFRMGFSRDTLKSKWESTNFQCTNTFQEDERKEYYDTLDITRAQE